MVLKYATVGSVQGWSSIIMNSRHIVILGSKELMHIKKEARTDISKHNRVAS